MKYFFILLFTLFAFACKKDGSGSGSGKLLLSKVFFNGLLENEYIYSIDGNLLRINNFTTGGGQSTLSSYKLFEYNTDGAISQTYNFTKDYEPTTRKVYTYSPQGKVTRIDEATIFTGDDDFDNMDYFEVYDYNVSGQLTSITRRLTNYTMHSITEYTYDDKGNLAGYKTTLLDDGDMVLKQQMDIDPGAKPMPDHWKAMLVTPTDLGLYEFFITGQKYTSYWLGPAGLVGTWKYLDRQYNNQGYVVKQTEQYESAGGSINLNERTFEYVQ